MEKASNYILSLADRCVKCGLCLPQCPTYNLTANENESPRGRIALVQGWLSGELSPTNTLKNHLDQCLLCRRCERVCPSQVPYGEIMDQSKALLAEKTTTHFSLQSLITDNSLKVLLNKKLSYSLISTLRLLQKTGLFFVGKKSGLLKLLGLHRLISYLPKLDNPITTKTFYPATEPKEAKGCVALFTGCLSKQLEPKTVTASIKILNRLGYGVHVPEQQSCCGALHLHDGDKKQAVTFANSNIKVFNEQNNITAIVSLVNGCTSQLREYSQLDLTDSFIPEVKDIVEFLAEIDWPKNITMKPLNKTVALQVPCSLQNILRAEDKLLSLIKRIPELSLGNIYNRCCGAAGSYFLRQPQLSDLLKNQAVEQLSQSSPDIIVSSNLGCALQLQSGLSNQQNSPEVLHPVVLLEQQVKLSS